MSIPIPGPMGESGPAGAQGEPGPQGPPGIDGAPGPAGPAGANGNDGERGIQGPAGPVGPAGVNGTPGPRGPSGGPAGPTGEVGPVGPAGPVGLTGPIGATGAKGDTGAAGPTGLKGDIGITGATGPAGTITGATAIVLAAGATPTVALGGTPQARTFEIGIPTGPQGAPGPQGDIGPKGDPGAVDNVQWADLLGKPATFPPTTGTTAATAAAGNHSHAAASATVVGLVELATNAEAVAGTDTVRAVTPANLAAVLLGRKVALADPIAIFLGNSHTTETGASAHWPQLLAASMAQGWTVKNYGISGTGFGVGSSTTKYGGQLTAANTALTTAEKARVRYVFVADMSNDVRNGVAPATIATEADALFTAIATAYPLARIICLPILWGTDATNSTQANRVALSAATPVLREACLARGVEHIEGSWTWHWGRTDLQDAGDFHYTNAGKAWIARWVERYLRGSETWRDIPWTPVVTYGNGYSGYTGGGWQAIAWCLTRGVITIQGTFIKGSAWVDLEPICNLVPQARPIRNVTGSRCDVMLTGDIQIRQAGSGAGSLAATFPLV